MAKDDKKKEFYIIKAKTDGKLPSPINLSIKMTTALRQLEDLKWFNMETPPSKMCLVNSGRTVVVTGQWGTDSPTLTGGVLPGEFVFSQVHFHWGQSDSEGSEHKIDGSSFPLEMHVMWYNSSYKSQRTALTFPDGVVVVAYIASLAKQSCPILQCLSERLKSIEKPRSQLDLPLTSLSALITPFTEDYLAYWGSINTDLCSHPLLWMLCRTPLAISSEDLTVWRALFDLSGQPMLKTYGITHACQGRTVFHVKPSKYSYNVLHPYKETAEGYTTAVKTDRDECSINKPRNTIERLTKINAGASLSHQTPINSPRINGEIPLIEKQKDSMEYDNQSHKESVCKASFKINMQCTDLENEVNNIKKENFEQMVSKNGSPDLTNSKQPVSKSDNLKIIKPKEEERPTKTNSRASSSILSSINSPRIKREITPRAKQKDFMEYENQSHKENMSTDTFTINMECNELKNKVNNIEKENVEQNVAKNESPNLRKSKQLISKADNPKPIKPKEEERSTKSNSVVSSAPPSPLNSPLIKRGVQLRKRKLDFMKYDSESNKESVSTDNRQSNELKKEVNDNEQYLPTNKSSNLGKYNQIISKKNNRNSPKLREDREKSIKINSSTRSSLYSPPPKRELKLRVKQKDQIKYDKQSNKLQCNELEDEGKSIEKDKIVSTNKSPDLGKSKQPIQKGDANNLVKNNYGNANLRLPRKTGQVEKKTEIPKPIIPSRLPVRIATKFAHLQSSYKLPNPAQLTGTQNSSKGGLDGTNHQQTNSVPSCRRTDKEKPIKSTIPRPCNPQVSRCKMSRPRNISTVLTRPQSENHKCNKSKETINSEKTV